MVIVYVHVHDAVSVTFLTVIVARWILDVYVNDSVKWKHGKEKERESREGGEQRR